jgi:hypothetical protein
VMKITFPHLHSFAKNDLITISSMLQIESFQYHFNLPLLEIAFEKFYEVSIILQSLPGNVQIDKWSYIWGNGSFSVSKVYNHFIGQEYVHPTFKWIWESCCQMKQHVFFWLLLQNRLNTRGLLQRKNMMLDSYTCEFCLL